jgi:hypothetical protein
MNLSEVVTNAADPPQHAWPRAARRFRFQDGKFKVKETPEREGRNPASGEKIKIAASRKLTFRRPRR